MRTWNRCAGSAVLIAARGGPIITAPTPITRVTAGTGVITTAGTGGDAAMIGRRRTLRPHAGGQRTGRLRDVSVGGRDVGFAST